uniref:Uncharacterized protein n=1 Tax=Oryza punctata TaxID=4537 RepID=A0A0E0LH17_ORYPU
MVKSPLGCTDRKPDCTTTLCTPQLPQLPPGAVQEFYQSSSRRGMTTTRRPPRAEQHDMFPDRLGCSQPWKRIPSIQDPHLRNDAWMDYCRFVHGWLKEGALQILGPTLH